MPPDRSFSLEDVRRLVARWSGDDSWRVEPAADGVSTPVFRLTRGRQTRYLRLAEQPGENRIAEKRVYDLLRARGVRVPAIVWFEPLAPEVDRSAMITAALPGAPLDQCIESEGALAIVAQAGRDLSRINGVPVRGFGWVVAVDEDGGLIAAHPDRAGWTAAFGDALIAIPEQVPLDRSRLAPIVGAWSALPGGAGSWLAHGDLGTSHIYGRGASYTGMIDFGEIRGADRAYDLGQFLLHEGEHAPDLLLPALLGGYRSAAPGVTITMREIVVQAIVIGIWTLARAAREPDSPYVRFLTHRLGALLDEFAAGAS